MATIPAAGDRARRRLRRSGCGPRPVGAGSNARLGRRVRKDLVARAGTPQFYRQRSRLRDCVRPEMMVRTARDEHEEQAGRTQAPPVDAQPRTRARLRTAQARRSGVPWRDRLLDGAFSAPAGGPEPCADDQLGSSRRTPGGDSGWPSAVRRRSGSGNRRAPSHRRARTSSRRGLTSIVARCSTPGQVPVIAGLPVLHVIFCAPLTSLLPWQA